MKKFDAKFIKYSVVLFIVSVLLISVGTVSLTRSVERTDKSNTSASNRIEILSNENLNLKQKVSELEAKNNDMNVIFEAEIMIENGDYENASKKLEKVDKKLLSEYAVKKYETLYDIVKENTK